MAQEPPSNDWRPTVQQAAALQSPPGEALEEILQWHKAEVRREAEEGALQAGGGLFDFEDLPGDPAERAPGGDAPRSRRAPLHLAERTALRAPEEAEMRATRSVKQQIQEALQEELKVIPLGDIRRRQLREQAQKEVALAPDEPPTPQQAREWARLLCVLQKPSEDLPGGMPEGQVDPAPKPVEILEPEAIEILKRRADVNHQVGDMKRYPLHMAAERCYPNLVLELLKARADPNKADFCGETPLHTVAHSGGWCQMPDSLRRLTIERLVEGGARANFANPRGRTPLHIAASSGDGLAISELIREAADVNAADLGGFTPLMWASGHGNSQLVQSLLDAEADMNLQANRGQTAMLFAMTNNKSMVVEALEGHLAIKEREEQWRKSLRQEPEKADAVQPAAAKGPKAGGATLHTPYMGKVREDFVPDLTSNVY